MKPQEAEDWVGRGPCIIPALAVKTGGVDFLGLRQVNLEMTGYCIPGISNTTRYIRPFSLLSWIHWRFHAELAAAGRTKVTDAEQRAFQDKAEILFTWGHKVEGLGGIPGTGSKPPPSLGGWVDMTFEAWDRRRDNTGLQAPVQYGPAIKPVHGLGFLESAGASFFHPTPEGEALAKALDSSLGKADAYKLLCSLDQRRARESDARDLLPRWQVGHATKREAEIFSRALYDSTSVDSLEIKGRRSAMITAILEVVRKARHPLATEEIRAGLVWNRVPKGGVVRLSGGVARITRHWKVLQIRQAQRVAMEAMLAWFESALQGGANRLEAVHARLRIDLENEKLSRGGVRTCAESLASLCSGLACESDYVEASATGDSRDLIGNTPSVQNEASMDPATALSGAATHLLKCIAWTRWLIDDKELARDLKLGGADRVSLWHLHESYHRFSDRSLSDWIEDVMERWVIGQHLRVATMRFDGGTQRLRFGFGEAGLEFYAERPSKPNLTPDHLAAILSLMANSGMLAFEAEDQTFSMP